MRERTRLEYMSEEMNENVPPPVPSIDLSTDCEKVIESTKSNEVRSLKQNDWRDATQEDVMMAGRRSELQKNSWEDTMKRKQEEDQKRVVKRIRKEKKKKTGKKKNKKDLEVQLTCPICFASGRTWECTESFLWNVDICSECHVCTVV